MRMRTILAVVAALAFAVGCSRDDDGPLEPTLAREKVAGLYELTTLSFDPQGSLPGRDVLARLEDADRPQLVLGRTDDTFQLAFRDPATGLLETPAGTYHLLADGVRLDFGSASEAGRLLLPQRVDLVFHEQTVTLAFEGNLSVPLPRLRELVPEFRDEPLTDPVPGRLTAHFTLQRR